MFSLPSVLRNLTTLCRVWFCSWSSHISTYVCEEIMVVSFPRSTATPKVTDMKRTTAGHVLVIYVYLPFFRLWDSNYTDAGLLGVVPESLKLSLKKKKSLFPPLSFRLGNVYWSILNFPDPFFASFQSTV